MKDLNLVQLFLLSSFVSSWIILLCEVFDVAPLSRKAFTILGVVWILSFIGLAVTMINN